MVQFANRLFRQPFKLSGVVFLSFLLFGCVVIPLEIAPPPTQPDRLTGDRPSPHRTAQSPTIAQMEATVRQRINAIRQENNLNQLQPNEKLAQVARDYSKLMAEKNFFSHTSPKGDGPAQRVELAGISYSLVGENLFTSTNAPDPVPLAVKGWMDSAGHRENILRPRFTQTGVGIWREDNTYYVTQLFLRPG
ncbi:MAG TPA: CAP domain-containing protein [Cyanobacteria bacterium UBA8803]|nr:CAP domain-containing protein [Cyanobacteria bacterium UBA9273]HBL58113.1 CAP domain-containing protein [Cyanobacteria bacterium UBA8803]